MSAESKLSYASYLAAKKTVDDRSLNRHVLDRLRQELSASGPLRVVEMGAGIGTMLARLVDWQLIQQAEYMLVDLDQECLAAAPKFLLDWATSSGRTASQTGDVLHISGGSTRVDITVRFVAADMETFHSTRDVAKPADLLVANAFLDLVEARTALPALFELLTPNALFWFSINFDGETLFQPEHHGDDALLGVYHQSMDDRVRNGKSAGDSRTGRHLFGHLRAAGASILGSGSSDWVVHSINNGYPAQEGEFVGHILNTIEAELNWRTEVDQVLLRDWLEVRREQLARGELTYIAHQLDFMGRRSA